MFTSVAIIGRPNVGKSSLFNKLTKSRDAIVSDFPGLTKDRNYGFLNLDDNKILIIDTGGIVNESDNLKEAISNQAWSAVEESSFIILMLDSSENLTKDDLDILHKLRKLNKDYVIVLNKVDKKTDSLIKNDLQKEGIHNAIEISAEHSKNLSSLKSCIKERATNIKKTIYDGKKVAVLGRPNAGKSTFINNLIDQDRLIVSEIAGTTIDSIQIPFEFDDEKFIFIDTAGIRKGYKYHHKVEYFSYVRTLHSIDQSNVVIFICDATEGLVDQDLKILNMIIGSGKPVLFLFNKIDLLSKKDLSKIYTTKKMQSDFMSNIFILEMSAIQKKGFKKIFNSTNKLIEKSKKKYSTSQLNKHLREFVKLNSPPSVKGRQLKFKHVHFAGTFPTTLIVHANQDKKIPQNYKRYLINSFRDALGLKSVQLRLLFRKADNPYKDKKNILSERQVKKRKRLIKHIKSSKK